MTGEIIDTLPVQMESGTAWQRTVIYEVGGERYRGCIDHQGNYYFGGGGPAQRHLADVHAAWELGCPHKKSGAT